MKIKDVKQAKKIITSMYLDENMQKKIMNKYKNRIIVGTIIMLLIGIYLAFASGRFITFSVVLIPIMILIFTNAMEIKTYNKKKQSVIDGTYFDGLDQDFILKVANQLYKRHPEYNLKEK
ncbi:MAG: hypothetical protein HUJ53_08940 [Holdemanella sp.]|nr:hypothetical protein [Holdemanella sp.]